MFEAFEPAVFIVTLPAASMFSSCVTLSTAVFLLGVQTPLEQETFAVTADEIKTEASAAPVTPAITATTPMAKELKYRELHQDFRMIYHIFRIASEMWQHARRRGQND
jgi:hypothetical protein